MMDRLRRDPLQVRKPWSSRLVATAAKNRCSVELRIPKFGCVLYAAGFAIWIFGYFSAGHAAVFDWEAATPWWISTFIPNLEAELGMTLMFASVIPIYGARYGVTGLAYSPSRPFWSSRQSPWRGGFCVACVALGLGHRREGDNAAVLGSNGRFCCCALSSGAWASLVRHRFLVHER